MMPSSFSLAVVAFSRDF